LLFVVVITLPASAGAGAFLPRREAAVVVGGICPVAAKAKNLQGVRKTQVVATETS
jgi:hypothetical protein